MLVSHKVYIIHNLKFNQLINVAFKRTIYRIAGIIGEGKNWRKCTIPGVGEINFGELHVHSL